MSTILLSAYPSPDPVAPPGQLWTGDNEPYMAFDNAVSEKVLWTFDVPPDYGSGLTASLSYSCAAGAGTFTPAIEIKCVDIGQNIAASVWDTPNNGPETSVPTTIGHRGRISWALPNLGAPSVWAANRYTSVRFSRVINAGIAAGDVYIWAVSLNYTAD